MKKLSIFLMVCILAIGAYATPLQTTMHRQSFRARLQAKLAVTPITSGDDFLKAVSKGDTISIYQVTDKTFLLATDAYGNNCFHLAKDTATLNVLEMMISRLESKQGKETLGLLRNQRNKMGETPYMYHLNSRHPAMFQQLFEGSNLKRAIENAAKMNIPGSALGLAASSNQTYIWKEARDNSGRTLAQAARANQDVSGMAEVVAYFEKYAPYLF